MSIMALTLPISSFPESLVVTISLSPNAGVLVAPKLYVYGPRAHKGRLSPAVQGRRRSFMGHLGKSCGRPPRFPGNAAAEPVAPHC